MRVQDLPSEPFDQMLTLTTDLFFAKEFALFWQPHLPPKAHVLDIGSGNGAYLNALHSHFPSLFITGLEPEAMRFQRAIKRLSGKIIIQPYLYEQYRPSVNFDIVIARLVIPHIDDRVHFAKWLFTHTATHATLFILDFDDECFQGNQQLPLFSKFFLNQRSSVRKPSFLDTKQSLRIALRHAGFTNMRIVEYAIDANDFRFKKQLYDYMKLTIQHFNRKPVNAMMLLQEIEHWYNNSQAMLDIPMYGMIVKKQAGLP